MRKSDRVAAYVDSLCVVPQRSADPRYLGYFLCFNRGDYYEAHDVLEDLWLESAGPNHEFYKALIQIAGAYVHMRKQFEQPHHPHHGRRLAPAARILSSAIARLTPFAPIHMGVDVDALLAMCRDALDEIESGGFLINPWTAENMPQVALTPSD